MITVELLLEIFIQFFDSNNDIYIAHPNKLKPKETNLTKRPTNKSKPNFPARGPIDSDLPLLLRSSKLGSLELLEDTWQE
jgi:hypothetical protein